MKSSSSTSLDWSLSKADFLNKDIIYGEFKDPRDNQVYKTLEIDGQVWMAENLNYADSAATPALQGNTWCYDDMPEKCALAGRLYTWAVAIDSIALLHDAENPQLCGDNRDCFMPKQVQGICPDGWHLPSKDEWTDLESSFWIERNNDGDAALELRSSIGWASDDFVSRFGNYWSLSGFAAIPVGHYQNGPKEGYSGDGGFVGGTGRSTYFWTSTQGSSANQAYALRLSYGSRAMDYSNEPKKDGNSVRCVKNGTYTTAPSWTLPKELQFNPAIEYGELVDERDGRVYKTVEIGEQTWMAENLNYDGGEGRSYCYGDDSLRCKKGGRLYDMKAAVGCTGDDTSCPRSSGLCPKGWGVPTKDEWETLFEFVGGEGKSDVAPLLRSQRGWMNGSVGTDEFGFSAIAVGYAENYQHRGVDFGMNARFWTSSVERCYAGSQNVCGIYSMMFFSTTGFSFSHKDSNGYFSVRCIKK